MGYKGVQGTANKHTKIRALDIVFVNLCQLTNLQGVTREYKVRRINTQEYELVTIDSRFYNLVTRPETVATYRPYASAFISRALSACHPAGFKSEGFFFQNFFFRFC